jgi:hypothetical protein
MWCVVTMRYKWFFNVEGGMLRKIIYSNNIVVTCEVTLGVGLRKSANHW